MKNSQWGKNLERICGCKEGRVKSGKSSLGRKIQNHDCHGLGSNEASAGGKEEKLLFWVFLAVKRKPSSAALQTALHSQAILLSVCTSTAIIPKAPFLLCVFANVCETFCISQTCLLFLKHSLCTDCLQGGYNDTEWPCTQTLSWCVIGPKPFGPELSLI